MKSNDPPVPFSSAPIPSGCRFPHPSLPLLLTLMLAVSSCGGMRPLPGQFNPADYTPVEFELLQRDSPSLTAGQLIRCQAYFWQFLTYDPSPRYYYFNQLSHPFRWSDLEWFALYQNPNLTGYFNRGTMSYEQRLQYNLKRLEPLILYGELVPMGGQQLYLQVHHVERPSLDD